MTDYVMKWYVFMYNIYDNAYACMCKYVCTCACVYQVYCRDKVFRIWACQFKFVGVSDCLSVRSFIRLSVSEVWDYILRNYPDSNVHGANMGPIWGRQDPGGPHIGPMIFAIWVVQVYLRSLGRIAVWSFFRYLWSMYNATMLQLQYEMKIIA